MNEHPILFSTEMVKAILDGRKTQTRRVIKHKTIEAINQCNYAALDGDGNWIFWAAKDVTGLDDFTPKAYPAGSNRGIKCPYGKPGDTLWVREAFMDYWLDGETEYRYKASASLATLALARGFGDNWKPSIHMPRWASRITLEVVSVRVERVQDITNEDALKEGMQVYEGHTWQPMKFNREAIRFETLDNLGYREYTPRDAFRGLWNTINEKRGFSWESNPWVWVVEFKKI